MTRDYTFNPFTGTLDSNGTCSGDTTDIEYGDEAKITNEEFFSLFHNILTELKLIREHLTVITDEEIRIDDIE